VLADADVVLVKHEKALALVDQFSFISTRKRQRQFGRFRRCQRFECGCEFSPESLCNISLEGLEKAYADGHEMASNDKNKKEKERGLIDE